MKTDEVVTQANNLRKRIQRYSHSQKDGNPGQAAQAQVAEFLRTYAGPKSAFFARAEDAGGYGTSIVGTLSAILDSFIEYMEAGLATGISPERTAQLDVVSDILGQADALLQTKSCHPAAAAVLIGASLEEFLRNWVEAEGLPIGGSKPSINAYCGILRKSNLITKQDVKDITSWAGTRNDAAHGEWDQVSDRSRIKLMLEGVNLFIRQKSV